jgi:hypothetical protein
LLSPVAAPLAFQSVLTSSKRLDVFGVGGIVLFGRMANAKGSLGPGGGYLNQLSTLEGTRVRPAVALQKGLWEDLYIGGVEGHWPDFVGLWGINYSNTAWERVAFVWEPTQAEWQTRQDDARPWPGGRIVAQASFASPGDKERFALQPSGAVLGIPDDLFANVPERSASLEIAAPRDLYARASTCEAGKKTCATTALRHWCAPRKGFETVALPQAVANASMAAVPGTALVYGEHTFVVRDGVVEPMHLPLPAPTLKPAWVKTTGGAIFYLGETGLFRLGDGGFHQLVAWTRDRASDKVVLPGAPKPVAITGFLARGERDFLLTTWDEKHSEVWSTTGEKLSL